VGYSAHVANDHFHLTKHALFLMSNSIDLTFLEAEEYSKTTENHLFSVHVIWKLGTGSNKKGGQRGLDYGQLYFSKEIWGMILVCD